MTSIHPDIERILLSEEDIREKVQSIADAITEDYKDKDGKLLLLCILRGAVVFMSDLMRAIGIPAEIDFMCVSSYGASTKSSGQLNIKFDVKRDDLDDCHVIIVEDIVDSGRTLSYLRPYLLDKGVRSVKTCAILDKPSRREVDFTADYIGASIPDEFIVGYGLDYDQRYRTLPYIGVLKKEIFDK